MKLHTVFITHNRLELTKQAVKSFLETVTVPFTLWVVDNASTDGTQEWIRENIREIGMGFTLFEENQYPGAACNEGWRAVEFTGIAEDATHLQRADNDWLFLPGWTEAVQRAFEDPVVGQVGLRTDEQDAFNTLNVAGDCVIRRQLWDEDMRWDERPWSELKSMTEDYHFSREVIRRGWQWTRVQDQCLVALASGDWDDPYYQESYGVRGIERPA